jgi:hypothetical protein
LDSPTKPTQKSALIDDTHCCPLPDSDSETKMDDLDELDLCKQFVGDIDLSESTLIPLINWKKNRLMHVQNSYPQPKP